ncbi:small GTP-binding protein domain [Pelomyxa schiedti]|nr:small GTP-binding protein domain [Pelomyxa schiedti]
MAVESVGEWLTDIGCGELWPTFESAGFRSCDLRHVAHGISDEDLERLAMYPDVKRGHVVRLRTALGDLRARVPRPVYVFGAADINTMVVDEWLAALGMPEVWTVFERELFDTMAVVSGLRDKDLFAVGLGLGTVVKLRGAISALNQTESEQTPTHPEPILPPAVSPPSPAPSNPLAPSLSTTGVECTATIQSPDISDTTASSALQHSPRFIATNPTPTISVSVISDEVTTTTSSTHPAVPPPESVQSETRKERGRLDSRGPRPPRSHSAGPAESHVSLISALRAINAVANNITSPAVQLVNEASTGSFRHALTELFPDQAPYIFAAGQNDELKIKSAMETASGNPDIALWLLTHPLKNSAERPFKSTAKVVVVGDDACGKTCLLISYTTKTFPSEYVPTVFDNYSEKRIIDGKVVMCQLWDTSGQTKFDRLRPLSYIDTDVFILIFSVDDKTSYYNVAEKWYPEVQHYCPNAQCIVAAAKTDLRQPGKPILTYQDGIKTAMQMGNLLYMECSALTRQGVYSLFEAAFKLASYGPALQAKGCLLL